MLSSKSQTSRSILSASLVVLMGFALAFKPTLHYLNLDLVTPENVQVSLLLNTTPDAEDCHQTLDALISSFESGCPTCRIQAQQCLSALSPHQQNNISAAPLHYPSIRFHNGVATYTSPDANLALKACQESELRSAQSSHKTTCYSSNTLRPIPKPVNNKWSDNLLAALLILVAAGIASGFICYLIIRYEHLHAHFSHDHINAGPQKFHAIPTPRIGGLALFGGLLIAAWLVPILKPGSSQLEGNFSYLLLAAIPAFFGGIVEDITKNVGVAQRLLLTMISAAIAAWLLSAVINRADIPLLDSALHWLPFAIAFTVFAVGGVANSINIIDGYNGLAGGFSIIVLIAIAWVAALVGDNLVLMVSVSMIGAMLGFLAWNWPKGQIFMGDGGAYLLGFMLAELSVLLICRNPSVSPWFPLLLLAYPVFETLFSMYRRKWVRKSTPGNPDALHLHQLIFKRIVRGHINGGCPHLITSNNSRVAAYIWLIASLGAIFAVLFWQRTSFLMMAFLTGCALYLIIYRQLTTLRLRGLVRWAKRSLQ
ncbi:MAG: MraY family glycosyltransferase [Methylotenera sp.]